jgi:hypothetical protein
MDLYDTLQQARTTLEPTVLDHTRRLLETECRGSARARVTGRSRRWAVPLAAATFLAGAGAAAWAVTRSDPTTATTIECGTDTFIPVQSGDPVVDCRNALAREETSVPPLEGWITPGGLVAVLPKGVAPPTGSTPLPSAFAVDSSVLYVSDVLGDEAQPIATTCTTSNAAVAFARSQLALAGLVGWVVQVQPSTGQGGPCAGYSGYLDASSHTVVLTPMPVSSPNSVDVRLDERLRTHQAATLVRSDANELGLAPADYSVNVASTIGENQTTCALVTIDPVGSIQATIWQVPQAQ